MNENSRNLAKEIVKKNCGSCCKYDVCLWKDAFPTYVNQLLHEAQINEHIVEIAIKCKYHMFTGGTTFYLGERSNNNAE